MKIFAKIAVSLLLVVAAAWIATPKLGPAKLKAQFDAEENENSLLMNRRNMDPRPPSQKTPVMKVQFLRMVAPLYFEAQTSVRGSHRYWGDLDHEKDIVTDEWGHDDTAAYLYTPWRVYRLNLSKHTEFYTRGVSLRERMRHEMELEKARLEREAALKAGQPAPATPPL